MAMLKSTAVFAGFTLLLIAGTAHAAGSCRYSAPRNADIDAAGLKSLQVTVGSSDVVIQGVPGLDRVEVRGVACASSEDRLEGLKIDTHRSGSEATVATASNGSMLSLFGWQRYAYLKLQVRVPESLAIGLRSGSGDVHASDLAALEAHVGSGDLTIERVRGLFSADSGSGDIRAHQVGSVRLGGIGSGDVNISDVAGDVQAGNLGSGDLTLGNVQGNVAVGSVSSGDVRLRQIGGSVRVDSVASGDVMANGVGGDFTVRAAGSGDIHQAGVKGKVSVPEADD